MVKARKITLMSVVLLVLVLLLLPAVVAHTVGAQVPLTQHFVSADGTLELDYPADWTVQDALGSITLSNSSKPFTGDQITPGTIFVVLFVESFEGSLPPQVERNLWSAMEHSLQQAEASEGENAPDFGEVVELPIGGYPSYHSRGVSATQDALILVLDLGGGYFGELSAVTAPGELDLFEQTLVAILASIKFTPPPPPVIAGSVVWQRTGAIGEPDGPDDFLIGLAVGPDDRIYTADSDTIFVFEPDGSGPRIIESSEVFGIRDLAVSAEGEIWAISNVSQSWFRFDSAGTLLGTTEFQSLQQIEIGPDGYVYLLDIRADDNGQPIAEVQVYTTEAVLVRTFRLDSELPVTLGETRMAFGPDGLLYVLNMNVLYQYSMDGVQGSQNIAARRLSEPGNQGLGLALDPNSDPSNPLIYVATGRGAILQQDGSGSYIQQFGALQLYPSDSAGDPPFGSGEFAHPAGVGVLSNGDVVVADANFDYWQVVRITFTGE